MAANPPLLDTSSTDKSSNTINILFATEVTKASVVTTTASIINVTTGGDITTALTTVTTLQSPTTTTIIKPQRPNCPCTNISIMQLFHEMKQEFPTVPDHVVSQCVLDNCHDRLACIANLSKESMGHLGIQAYPSQTLHNNIKLTGLPRRLSGDNKYFNNNNEKNNNNNNSVSVLTNNYDNNHNYNNNHNNNKFQKCVNNFNNINNNNNNKSDYKSSDMSQSKSDNNRKIPQRPTTLSLSSKPNPSGTFSRPTRVAPPPPPPTPISLPSQQQQQQISTGISSALTSALTGVPTATNYHHHYHQSPAATAASVITTTTTTTDSPANPDSINVSLNVTVSPVSPRPPVRPPRHTSAISVQPEPAYIRDVPTSPRSYTSVNFTLRQPSQSPQSPIDISAGPSLTYTSSSFDARQGYQSRLQITMGGGGGGGSISAMRTRPRNTYNRAAIQNDNDDDEMQNALANPKSEAEIVHRQLVKKQCLSSALTSDKGRLERMQREIRALEAPLPVGGSTKLQEDIEQLRFQCTQMASEVEAAGNYVLGETNEAFYQNIYTGQKLPTQSRPPKPPRPPPPRPPAIQTLINNNNNNNNISNNRTDLNTSGNGGGDNNFNLNNNDNDHVNNNNNNNNGEGGQPWTCSMCTFWNHPLLDKCEQCEMPRISSGTVPIGPQLNRQRMQDRHYQQSPPSPNNNNNNNIPSPLTFSNYNLNTDANTNLTSTINTATTTTITPLNLQQQSLLLTNLTTATTTSNTIYNNNYNYNNNTLLDTANSNLSNERILLLLPSVITANQSTTTNL